MRTILSLALLLAGGLASADLIDSFDTLDAGWTTDRYEPAGFQSAFFDGDNRLKLSISSEDSIGNRPVPFNNSFYDYQGRGRDSGVVGDWSASFNIYVSSDLLSNPGEVRSEFWVRDAAANDVDANYAIMGFASLGGGAGFYAWDPDANHVEFAPVPATVGWWNLSMVGTGTSVAYYLNGSLFYTDATGSTAGNEGARTVYLHGYNSGYDYDVYMDDVQVNAVPEPATLALLGVGALALRRRRRS